jgi:L-threonylcarbamoyladenylate synthase
VPELKRCDVRAEGLPKDQEEETGRALREGALVIYPTDTLYAIGCLARDGAAVGRLREAKGRDADKALPVIAADLAQAMSLADAWPEEARLLSAVFWPGPLTLVVSAARSLPRELLAGGASVAVRVPASLLARQLASLAGPLVATSANLAGEEPCTTVDLAARAFPAATLAFDAGPLEGAPSTIVNLTRGRSVVVLREGRVSTASIERVLGPIGPGGVVSSRSN